MDTGCRWSNDLALRKRCGFNRREYNFVSNDGRLWWSLIGRSHAQSTVSCSIPSACGSLESISLAGTSVLTFRPQDLLLIICMNGTKDVWKSLKQICDVASNPRSSGARWDQVMKQSRILGSERMLLLSCLLASDLLGTSPGKVSKNSGRSICKIAC